MDSSVFSKRNVVVAVILVVMAIAIPIGMNLLQKTTQLKSKASEVASDNQIKFKGTGVNCDAAGKCTTSSDKVDLELRSPWPISITPTPTKDN